VEALDRFWEHFLDDADVDALLDQYRPAVCRVSWTRTSRTPARLRMTFHSRQSPYARCSYENDQQLQSVAGVESGPSPWRRYGDGPEGRDLT